MPISALHRKSCVAWAGGGSDEKAGSNQQFMAAACSSKASGPKPSADSTYVLGAVQELGVGVLQNLHRQRETLVHARDTLHGADDGLAKARRVLAGMSRRIMTNKVIMIGICALLIGAIVLVIYAKFIRSS